MCMKRATTVYPEPQDRIKDNGIEIADGATIQDDPRVVSTLRELRAVRWRDVETLTIQDCDPVGCRFEACPNHQGQAGALPVKETEQAAPRELIVKCGQRGEIAQFLIMLSVAFRTGQRNKRKGRR